MSDQPRPPRFSTTTQPHTRVPAPPPPPPVASSGIGRLVTGPSAQHLIANALVELAHQQRIANVIAVGRPEEAIKLLGLDRLPPARIPAPPMTPVDPAVFTR